MKNPFKIKRNNKAHNEYVLTATLSREQLNSLKNGVTDHSEVSPIATDILSWIEMAGHPKHKTLSTTVILQEKKPGQFHLKARFTAGAILSLAYSLGKSRDDFLRDSFKAATKNPDGSPIHQDLDL